MSTIEEWESSLRSAQLVQQGLLPKKRHFERLFSESMVIYQPKEIISGDFYWIGKKHDHRYIVVGDCTGHGISASMTAVLALNLLEYIIMNKGIKRPDRILEELDKRFIESFTGHDQNNFDNPWIDIAIVSIDDHSDKMYFAAANRKIIHYSEKEGNQIIKANGYPIGGWQYHPERNFEQVQLNYDKGDKIYLGSDGYQDQFGGPLNKKFGSSNLHNLIHSGAHLDMEEQKERLSQALSNWKGNFEQTDDICIVGIEV